MSNAIAQNTNDAAVSTPSNAQDFKSWVVRLATKAIKNADRVATTGKFTLNYTKLLKAMRDEWKMHNGMPQRVPDEVDTLLQQHVTEFITAQVNTINAGNALSLNTRDVLDFKNLRIYEKVTATGSNSKTLQAQLEACNRLTRECKDKIEYYERQDASGNSKKDYADLLKKAKSRLTELELTKHHLKGTIESVTAAVKP